MELHLLESVVELVVHRSEIGTSFGYSYVELSSWCRRVVRSIRYELGTEGASVFRSIVSMVVFLQ
jgi:hypothetical protein